MALEIVRKTEGGYTTFAGSQNKRFARKITAKFIELKGDPKYTIDGDTAKCKLTNIKTRYKAC